MILGGANPGQGAPTGNGASVQGSDPSRLSSAERGGRKRF
jgi:hypothetical protein